MWFSVVCTLIHNDLSSQCSKCCGLTRRAKSSESTTKESKEQALSLAFSQFDWFIIIACHLDASITPVALSRGKWGNQIAKSQVIVVEIKYSDDFARLDFILSHCCASVRPRPKATKRRLIKRRALRHSQMAHFIPTQRIYQGPVPERC